MNKWLMAICGIWALACPAPGQAETPPAAPASGGPAKVVVIPVRAQIASPELFILRRGLKQAIEEKADTVILDMKTPGGALDVTLEMMEALDRFPGRKITYVNDEAISAGAIIASVTDEIHFAPKATIGAAEVIMGTGQDVSEGLKRKLNSYMGAKIRAYSEENPHRAQVIRAMMEPDYELKIGDTVIKAEGELLSLTATEALKPHGNPAAPLLGAGISENIEALIAKLHGPGAEVRHLEVTWSEKAAQYLTAIAPLLMGIGLLALFIEFKTPGFGVFGITGLSLLAVVFLSQYVAGLSGHEPLLFFLLGVVLVAVEIFFFPGTMVAALTGAALMFGSLVWAMLDLWPQQPINISGGELAIPPSSSRSACSSPCSSSCPRAAAWADSCSIPPSRACPSPACRLSIPHPRRAAMTSSAARDAPSPRFSRVVRWKSKATATKRASPWVLPIPARRCVSRGPRNSDSSWRY